MDKRNAGDNGEKDNDTDRDKVKGNDNHKIPDMTIDDASMMMMLEMIFVMILMIFEMLTIVDGECGGADQRRQRLHASVDAQKASADNSGSTIAGGSNSKRLTLLTT